MTFKRWFILYSLLMGIGAIKNGRLHEEQAFLIGERPIKTAVIVKDGQHYISAEALADALDAKITQDGSRIVLDYEKSPNGRPHGGVWVRGWTESDSRGASIRPGKWIGAAAPTVKVVTEAPAQAEPVDIYLVNSQVVADGFGQAVKGEVFNRGTNDAYNVYIRFEVLDRDGKKIYDTIDNTERIEARTTWRFSSYVPSAGVKVKFLSLKAYGK